MRAFSSFSGSLTRTEGEARTSKKVWVLQAAAAVDAGVVVMPGMCTAAAGRVTAGTGGPAKTERSYLKAQKPAGAGTGRDTFPGPPDQVFAFDPDDLVPVRDRIPCLDQIEPRSRDKLTGTHRSLPLEGVQVRGQKKEQGGRGGGEQYGCARGKENLHAQDVCG